MQNSKLLCNKCDEMPTISTRRQRHPILSNIILLLKLNRQLITDWHIQICPRLRKRNLYVYVVFYIYLTFFSWLLHKSVNSRSKFEYGNPDLGNDVRLQLKTILIEINTRSYYGQNIISVKQLRIQHLDTKSYDTPQ